jgi:vanillate O-demethylase ferredoxin subunit
LARSTPFEAPTVQPTTDHRLKVRARTLRFEAEDVISIELADFDGNLLPEFTAGAHVDVFLPNGVSRSYSLVNSQNDRSTYLIAVFRGPRGADGSKYIHEDLRPGQVLWISPPRNNFPLAEAAERHVFIAGGIGITPFCSMLDRLNELGHRWKLFYCVRTRLKAAFVDRVAALADKGRGEVVFTFDGEAGGRLLDISAVVAAEDSDTHFYCCGPNSMLTAYRVACASLSPEHVHLEYFSSDVAAATGGGFVVVLARSGRRVPIPPGETILDALINAGLQLSFSCKEGICGACETGVIAGLPDHRDMILTEGDRGANGSMMICCSGSRTPELVLDL